MYSAHQGWYETEGIRGLMYPPHRVLITAIVLTAAAFGQRPIINQKGIINAASFAGTDQPGSAIVPGAIASLFGQNLASTTQQARSLPLPSSLADSSVTVDGTPAPLFYVSPTQINFEVPYGLFSQGNAAARQVPVVVTTPAGVSEPVLVQLEENAVGAFTLKGTGCGPGAIQNIEADGSRTVNDPAQSASPGSYVSVYSTGLGWLIGSPPPDGQPALPDPLSWRLVSSRIYLGPPGFARQAPVVTFEGRAPGLVGVDQIDFQIPDSAPEGCAVPLTIGGVSSLSQPVTVSIRRGGGRCEDAPLARFASFRWTRAVATGPDPALSTTLETFTGSVAESPSNQAVPLPGSADSYCSCSVGDPLRGPSCPGTGLRTLGIGPLTLQNVPGGPVTVSPSVTSGEVMYSAVLPTGSLKGGTFAVSAMGGSGIGAFQTSLAIPAPLQLTTALTSGTVLPANRAFPVNWTGGTPEAVVRVRVLSRLTPERELGCECSAPASDGGLNFNVIVREGDKFIGLIPSEDARAVITVEPRTGMVATFSAPGLTRDATHAWSYVYEFRGLKVRPAP